jgi:beta-aspartyl-peptidase (threonine type)
MSSTFVAPMMVASENGRAGMAAAMRLLRNGGRALDAVELACRITEADPDDHSVGYGGMPNALGDVELDASIMDGRSLHSGAVAAVYGYAHPITLARQVMEELPHVLLVGRGAERFAAEMGHRPAEQRSAQALALWRARFPEEGLTPGSSDHLRHTVRRLTQPVTLTDRSAQPEALPTETREQTLGTVNFLARDQYGDLASAVSTSGIAWKYPSRVGDSPIIGAGNYCDNRYGAVACTGMGELAIRATTARSVILYLKQGMDLVEAGFEALRDLAYFVPLDAARMNFVAMTPDGRHAGFTTQHGRVYLAMGHDQDEAQSFARLRLAD